MMMGSKQGGGGGNNGSEEKDKFKDMISEAIVTEKPNISWEDIAGLENAKVNILYIYIKIIFYFLKRDFF